MTATLCLLAALASADNDRHPPLYELRTYTAAPGKFDAMSARFRDHTLKLFAKHGMTNVAYFVPTDNKDHQLIYLLRFANADARSKAWQAFGADAAWKKVFADSEVNGKLAAKIESRLLTPTDYSPALKIETTGDRVFELRSYTASAGKLGALNSRFRDHTLKLFEKHGIANVVYFTPAAGQPGAGDTLIYFLAHASPDAAKKSFGSFRDDPAWVNAKKASEEKAGGSLTVKDGVKSLFLTPVDYSPLK